MFTRRPFSCIEGCKGVCGLMRMSISGKGHFSDKEQKERKQNQLDRLAKKAEAAEKFAPDPVVEFGQYKGDGLKLSDLPSDYLEFLTTPTNDGSDFVHRGVNWTHAARGELTRRLRGEAVQVKPLDEMSVEDVERPPKVSVGRVKTEDAVISIEVMDEAAVLLLREFITRKDKDKLLSEWLKEYIREVARYGIVERFGAHGKFDMFTLVYRGCRFEIRVSLAEVTLVRILFDGSEEPK